MPANARDDLAGKGRAAVLPMGGRRCHRSCHSHLARNGDEPPAVVEAAEPVRRRTHPRNSAVRRDVCGGDALQACAPPSSHEAAGNDRRRRELAAHKAMLSSPDLLSRKISSAAPDAPYRHSISHRAPAEMLYLKNWLTKGAARVLHLPAGWVVLNKSPGRGG